jgi:hypothetical protein
MEHLHVLISSCKPHDLEASIKPEALITGQTEGLKVGCGGMGGRKDGWRNGWIGGQREKVRVVYGFSSLMKQNKREKLRCLLLRRKKKIIIFIFTL